MTSLNIRGTNNSEVPTEGYAAPSLGGHSYGPQEGAQRSRYEQQQGGTPEDRDLGTVRKHTHDDKNSPKLKIKDLVGFIPTVSTAPTTVPIKHVMSQFVMYKNGATKRLYMYDFTNAVWSYVALT